MAAPKTETKPRRANPLCAGGCSHPRSMHGAPPGKCKAIGCRCKQFETPQPD